MEPARQTKIEICTPIRASSDLLLRLNSAGRVLDCKVDASSDLAIQREKVFGKGIQQIPVKQIRERFLEAIHCVLKERTLMSFEYSLMSSGYELLYEARLAPLAEDEVTDHVWTVEELLEKVSTI